MKASSNRILTTHVGSLPRPDDLIAANRSREAGEAYDETIFQENLRAGVAQVVQNQRDLGIDIPGDGEFGKSMGHRVNFGAWMSYAYHRLGGLDLAGPDMHDVAPRRSSPGQPVLDKLLLTGAIARGSRRHTLTASLGCRQALVRRQVRYVLRPLSYIGGDAIKADIANFKAALDAADVEEGFL